MKLGEILQGLSSAQKNAMRKLIRRSDWASAYQLQESRLILDALVAKGLVKIKRELGYLFSPRTHILYKAKFRLKGR